MNDLTLRCRHVVTRREGVRDAVVIVRDGQIADILEPTGLGAGTGPVEDLGDLWLLPGLVDTHVHVNEPGRTEWEGFETATRAAAAGGVTTIVDMPLNAIPATTTAEALRVKRAAAEGRCHVDVGFWGGIVPGNLAEIEPLAREGALGFKCFLVPSGVDEFPHVGERDLEQVVPEAHRIGALPVLAHAEHPEVVVQATLAAGGSPHRSHRTWLASRPPAAEVKAVRMMAQCCQAHANWLHVVHLSASTALSEIAESTAGRHLTVETCPHYLCFDAEEIPDGATEFKCAPPIRERVNRERLWAALKAGDIHMIVSDHSPCPPSMKQRERGDFMTAWGGIASLELGLSAVWTEARHRGIRLERVVEWMCAAPASLAGLVRKGRIQVGSDADLVVFDPDAEWTVAPEALHQRHKITPYAGRRMHGRVARTYVRGRPVCDRGDITGAPAGRFVLRGGYEARFGPPPPDLERGVAGVRRPGR